MDAFMEKGGDYDAAAAASGCAPPPSTHPGGYGQSVIGGGGGAAALCGVSLSTQGYVKDPTRWGDVRGGG